ncbi:hypothetical protein I6G96_08955 [Delftia acidovorans]|uniref:hypothetical protein n=1 Tax=Delftia acidovorans TaxID=80866 RepID=UPI0018D7DBB8|nr:hypothetical protein [Delftia acidovorans]QPR36517.1 hypothetical protein I6G96_08955 [Delftia acidovorans]
MQTFDLHASKQAIKSFVVTGNTNIRRGAYIGNAAPCPVIPDEAAPRRPVSRQTF